MRQCLIPNCESSPRSGKWRRGWCDKHYSRWYKHGDPVAAGVRENAGKHLDGKGYVRLPLGDGRSVAEHRAVMERKLGRALLPGENVHHINGVRDDNRPANLELWVVAQPAGQRPEDLVRWAQEILARYSPLGASSPPPAEPTEGAI